MKINAVGVASSDFKKTAAFYGLLGFEFPDFKDDEQHIETVPKDGSTKLMLDAKEMMKDLIGEEPKPGNHSVFAVEYDSPKEVDAVANRVKAAGFKVVTEPWDAVWGQRYAVVQDPDGYRVDLYAVL